MRGGSGRLVRFVFVLCAGALAAAPASAAVRWGVVAGPLVARFAGAGGEAAGLSREAKLAWSGGAGALAEWAVGRNFGLLAGAEYAGVTDQARVTNHSVQFVVDGRLLEMQALWTIRQHTVSVPVLLEYRRGPLRLGAGPELRFLLDATRSSSEVAMVDVGPAPAAAGGPRFSPAAQIFEEVGTFTGGGDATSFYERLTVAAVGSAGVRWPAGTHEGRAEVRVATDVSEASTELAGGERATTVQLRIGVLW